MANKLWQHEGFFSDITLLGGNYFSRIGYDDLVRISVQQAGPDEFRFASGDEISLFKDALIGLKDQVGLNAGPLLSNPLYNLDYRQYVDLPVVLFEFEDRSMSVLSYQFAANYDFRLQQIFHKGLEWFYQDESFEDRFKEEFRSLNDARLKDLGEKGVVRFFISDRTYDSLKLVYANRHFRVYDLGSKSGL